MLIFRLNSKSKLLGLHSPQLGSRGEAHLVGAQTTRGATRLLHSRIGNRDEDDEDATGESVGFVALNNLKKELDIVKQTADTIQKTVGPTGPVGKRGPKGERGEPLRFEDLSQDQCEEIRGPRGVQGPRGQAMVFEDLTSEQRGLLKGQTGERGSSGTDGETGPTGPTGRAFTFDDFTDTQRELISGERGPRGERGDALTFEELNDAQKHAIRGEKGERGHKGDNGERGERGRVGPTGPIGAEGKQGPRGLPGVPGSKGDRGEKGESGHDGHDGRSALIKTSFMSIELLRDYIHKNLHMKPNTYYIIDHPTDEEHHGELYTYTGDITFEMTVGCSHLENIQSLLNEYDATVKNYVQDEQDEWKLSILLRSSDICVYQIRRGLENSITQGGYMVTSSVVTEDAIRLVGRLCGVQGRQGDQGAKGDSGMSMIGLHLDYIGTDVSRLKLQDPEVNSIFLQVNPSKTHEAGFYLFDDTRTWALLQGVDVQNSFMQWMAQVCRQPTKRKCATRAVHVRHHTEADGWVSTMACVKRYKSTEQ